MFLLHKYMRRAAGVREQPKSVLVRIKCERMGEDSLALVGVANKNLRTLRRQKSPLLSHGRSCFYAPAETRLERQRQQQPGRHYANLRVPDGRPDCLHCRLSASIICSHVCHCVCVHCTSCPETPVANADDPFRHAPLCKLCTT